MIRLLLSIWLLLPTGVSAQLSERDLDSIYLSYMSDSAKAQIQKQRDMMAQIEQQRQQREQRQKVWYLVLAGCAVSAIIVTGGIFRSVFQGHADAPLRRKLSAGAVCLAGGVAVFLMNALWLYLSFEGNDKAKKLFVFALLLILGIALWIYTKKQR